MPPAVRQLLSAAEQWWNDLLHRRKARQFRIRTEQVQRANEREAQLEPSRILRLRQGWQIRRRLRAEKRANWELANPEGHARKRWLYSAAFWFVSMLFLMGFAYSAYRLTRPGATPVMDNVAASVNGEDITDEQMVIALRLLYGPVVLQRLVEREVIRQEGAKRGISLTDIEERELRVGLPEDATAGILLDERRTTLLLKKIVLAKAGQERKREIYRDFKEDLRVFSLTEHRFLTRDRAKRFTDGLRAGASRAELDKLSLRKGLNEKGKVTLAAVSRAIGPKVAREMGRRGVGFISEPISVGDQWAVFVVDHVESTFEAAEASIEDMIVEADSVKVLYELIKASDIVSKYQKAPPIPVDPAPTPGRDV